MMRILGLVLPAVLVSSLFVACGSDGSSTRPSGEGGTVLSCPEACPGVLAAHCPGGPRDQADCEGGCDAILSKCESQFYGLYQCAGTNPTYKCGSAIGVIVNGCEAQSSALESCMTAP
jgi:hypothetical protein